VKRGNIFEISFCEKLKKKYIYIFFLEKRVKPNEEPAAATENLAGDCPRALFFDFFGFNGT